MAKVNNNRRYPGVRGRRPDKAAARKEVEAERLAWWRSLTPAEQLNVLDRRLGVGLGAKKQRAKITAQLGKKEQKAPQVIPHQETSNQEQVQPKTHQKAKDRRKAERKKSD